MSFKVDAIYGKESGSEWAWLDGLKDIEQKLGVPFK